MFSRRVILLLLAALIVLSIAVRYPLVEHERFQTDSYTFHIFAKSIVDNGYAKWTFNPLSYLGYYPIAYPSGSPFLLAELSEATGLNIESSILLLNLLFAVLFCLGAFLLALQFIRRPEYALLAAFFAVTGARFVDTTYWDASARGPMIVYLVLVLFVLFRAAATGQNKLLLFALLLGIGCFATHHMAVLLLLFGLSYILAVLQAAYLLPRLRTKRRLVAAATNGAIATSILIVSFGFFKYFSALAAMNLRESSLFNLDSPELSIVLNMAVSYTSQIGFIIVFAALAIPSIFREKPLSVENLFLVAALLAFIPMYGNALYVSMILAPFVSILGVVYVARIIRGSRRRRFAYFIVLLLICTAIFVPVWSSQRWNKGGDYLSGQTVEVDSRIYSDGTYLKHQYPGTFGISNVNTYWIQVGAFSDTRFLASEVFLAINGDVVESDMRANVTWSSAPFPNNLYNLFEYDKKPNVDAFVQQLVVNGFKALDESGTSNYFSTHTKLIVAIDNNNPKRYAGTYNLQYAALPDQLKNASWELHEIDSYMIYQSGSSTVYAVGLDR